MQIIGLLSLVVPVFFWAFLTVSVWSIYEKSKSKNKSSWLYFITVFLFATWAVTLILPEFIIRRAAQEMVIDQGFENNDIVESIDLLAE